MTGTYDTDEEAKVAEDAWDDEGAELSLSASCTGMATGMGTATDFSSSLLSSPFPTSSVEAPGSLSLDDARLSPPCSLNDAACVDLTFFLLPGRRACVNAEGDRSNSGGECCSLSSTPAVALLARERPGGPAPSRAAKSCMNRFLPPAVGEERGAALVGLLAGEAAGDMEAAACWAFRTAPSSLWRLVQ